MCGDPNQQPETGRPLDAGAWYARVYDDLRERAGRLLAGERAGHTLSPTALVNESYLRLHGIAGIVDRAHFGALAAAAMRHVLVDHARGRNAAKRRPRGAVVRLDTGVDLLPRHDAERLDVLAVHEALERLAQLHARQAALVAFRYFGGMSVQDAADALGISLATAESDWRMARTWLHRELSR